MTLSKLTYCMYHHSSTGKYLMLLPVCYYTKGHSETSCCMNAFHSLSIFSYTWLPEVKPAQGWGLHALSVCLPTAFQEACASLFWQLRYMQVPDFSAGLSFKQQFGDTLPGMVLQDSNITRMCRRVSVYIVGHRKLWNQDLNCALQDSLFYLRVQSRGQKF